MLDLAAQLATTAADQFAASMAQADQVLGGLEQRGVVGVTGVAAVGVSGQLRQGAAHLALGLQQQALRIAGQFAGGEQIVGGKALQLQQAGLQIAGQVVGQAVELVGKLADGLGRRAVAQSVAAGQVGVDVLRHVLLEALRQAQVARHQLVGALQGLLRPPEGGPQGQADADQQQGVEIGEQFQAHPDLGKRSGDRPVTV